MFKKNNLFNKSWSSNILVKRHLIGILNCNFYTKTTQLKVSAFIVTIRKIYSAMKKKQNQANAAHWRRCSLVEEIDNSEATPNNFFSLVNKGNGGPRFDYKKSTRGVLSSPIHTNSVQSIFLTALRFSVFLSPPVFFGSSVADLVFSGIELSSSAEKKVKPLPCTYEA